MPTFTCLTFYRFIRLPLAGRDKDLPTLRVRLRKLCTELDLRGTILIAEEGINAGLSGSRESIDRFRDFARQEFSIPSDAAPGPGDLESAFKLSEAERHPFNRLLVRIKKEIISLGISTVRPDEHTGKRLSAAELKQWLDEGRPVVLLDTRNQYEVDVGTFHGAETMNLDTFREFGPKAVELAKSLGDRPVVSFCTGGIRCEKASALLEDLGVKDVYQLDGGILRYFEENGNAHYEGDCFVFDWRMAVNGKLEPVQRSEDPNATFGRHLPNPERKVLNP